MPKLTAFYLLCGLLVFSSTTINAQTPDTAYQNRIKEYTTDGRFYPSSVAEVYDHPTIPSPMDHFGTIIGEPGVMHHSQDIYDYMGQLAATSSRLSMEQIGTSEEGRPIQLIAISNEATMENLERYRDVLSRLADPRTTDAETAEELIALGKPVYYLNGGMHSPEMGSPEMLMELAYRLITDEGPEIQHIRDNVIVLINPVSEPDGRDKQVDWYYRYTKAKTDWDDGMRSSAPYWGEYVYHDNNRDGLQVSQEISKAILKTYMDWHPNVMLDLHESVPLLYISTGTGPYNENVDPVTVGEWQAIANQEMIALSAQGLPGVFTWAFYDGWWPGYGIWVANNHNSIGRFYETFGNAGANTFLRDINRRKLAGDEITSREWYRPDPASRMVYWSARNNTNYMQAAVLASLQYAADNDKNLLRNFYQKGVNSIKAAQRDKLKMFTIPTEQRDPAMVAYLVNQLHRQAIEIHHNEAEGAYAIFLDQPYGPFAKGLLTAQRYPKEAKFPPYDDIAWTLGYLYGVDVIPHDSLLFEREGLELVTKRVETEDMISGRGRSFVIPYEAQSGVVSALYAAGSGATINIMDEEKVLGGDTLAPGSLLLGGLSTDQARDLSSRFGVEMIATNADLGTNRSIKLPRIAIYHSWYDTQAEGWVRFTFEEKGIPYASIDKDDLKAGGLNERFDLIVIPHTRGDGMDLLHGIDEKFSPMPFTKTDDYPHHGYPDATDDMTGGPGHEGIANLTEFVKSGGILVPLYNAARSIADLGLSRSVSAFSPGNLFHPGSVVTVQKTDDDNPILYGYPETFHLFKGNGHLLNTPTYDRSMKILRYGTKDLKDEVAYTGEIMGGDKMPASPEADTMEKKETDHPPYVHSGMVRNESQIIGHAAILNAPVGDGHIVFYTFNPLHRYLNHHDSGLFWNTVINWEALD